MSPMEAYSSSSSLTAQSGPTDIDQDTGPRIIPSSARHVDIDRESIGTPKEDHRTNTSQCLGDAGYIFDDSGILRQISNGMPFPFKGVLSSYCKTRYDLFRRLTAKYVRNMLMKKGFSYLTVQVLNTDMGIRVLHSADFFSNTHKLLVVIQAGGVARAGVWSPRLLMHASGGIRVASQIPHVERALQQGYAVLIINPNEHIAHKLSGRVPSSEELIHTVWKHLVPRSPAEHVLIMAHMYAGIALVHPLQPPPHTCPITWSLSPHPPPPDYESVVSGESSARTSGRTARAHTSSHVSKSVDRGNAASPLTTYLATNGDSSSSTDSVKARGSALHDYRFQSAADLSSGGPSLYVTPDTACSTPGRKKQHPGYLGQHISSTKVFPSPYLIVETDKAGLNQHHMNPKRWDLRRQRFWRDLKKRVRGIVFTDTVLNLKMQGIVDEGALRWFERNCIHYVASVEPLNKRVDQPSFFRDVPTYSAGTNEHDLIPSIVLDKTFNFFERKISETCERLRGVKRFATSPSLCSLPSKMPSSPSSFSGLPSCSSQAGSSLRKKTFVSDDPVDIPVSQENLLCHPERTIGPSGVSTSLLHQVLCDDAPCSSNSMRPNTSEV